MEFYLPFLPFFLVLPCPDINALIDVSNSPIAGISRRKITIIMKFKMITSADGVEPLNNAAKIAANITIYMIAIEAIITMYENILSHIDDRFSEW